MHHATAASVAHSRGHHGHGHGHHGRVHERRGSSFEKFDADARDDPNPNSLSRGGGPGGGGSGIIRSSSALPPLHPRGRGAGSGLAPHAAPSALRKSPKYSCFPYARSDLGGGSGGGTSLSPRGFSDVPYYYGGGNPNEAAGADAEEGLCLPLRQPAGTLGAHGPILARTSPRLLLLPLVRRWRDGYWAHVYPTTLAVFRSLNDFEEWREHGGPGSLVGADAWGGADGAAEAEAGAAEKKSGAKPAAEEKQKNKNVDKLVKWSVDFDTLGVVRKKERKLRKERRRREKEERKEERRRLRHERRLEKKKKKRERGHKHKHHHHGEEESRDEEEHDVSDDDDEDSVGESTLLLGGESAARSEMTSCTIETSKTDKSNRKSKSSSRSHKTSSGRGSSTGVLKYSLLPVHAKPHKSKLGGTLHAFKLEKWTREGASASAAFASSDPGQVRALRSVLRELIGSCERDRSDRAGNKPLLPDDRPSRSSGAAATALAKSGGASEKSACMMSPATQASEAGNTATTSTPSSHECVSPRSSLTPIADSSSIEEGPVAGIRDPSRAARLHLSDAAAHQNGEADSVLSGSYSGGRARRRGPRFVHKERRRRKAGAAAAASSQ